MCGLSQELCICEEVAKTETRIRVVIEKRKWGKQYTVLQNLDSRDFNLKDMAKQLRTKLACGGTVKNDAIELQGNHEWQIIKLLTKMGFDPDSIDITKKF